MQKYNQAQANIFQLVRQQTHVVRSQLQEIHRQAWKHEEKLNLFKNELTNLNHLYLFYYV